MWSIDEGKDMKVWEGHEERTGKHSGGAAASMHFQPGGFTQWNMAELTGPQTYAFHCVFQTIFQGLFFFNLPEARPTPGNSRICLGIQEVNQSLIAKEINSGLFTFTSCKAYSSYLRTLDFLLGFLVD